MRYAMMKRTTNWMPPVRQKRSQNAGVAYTLVDDVPRVVDVLMSFPSLTESEFDSPLRVLTIRPHAQGRIHWTMVSVSGRSTRPTPVASLSILFAHHLRLHLSERIKARLLAVQW